MASVSANGATCESPAPPGENGEPPTCVNAPVLSIENELKVIWLAVSRKFPFGCTSAKWGALLPMPMTKGDESVDVSVPVLLSEKMKMSPSVEAGTNAKVPAGFTAMKSGADTGNGEPVASVKP